MNKELWCMLTDEYGEHVADKEAILEILKEYEVVADISETEIQVANQVIALPITAETAKRLISEVGENNELYRAITAVYAGHPLSEYPIPEWSQHWPVIDADLCLTGEYVDSDVSGWHNFRDEAAIWDVDAIAAGWLSADRDLNLDDGYVYPPEY